MDLFIPKEIKEISSQLKKSGFQCYLVGGAIRNQLLNKDVKDYDLTTNAEPEQVKNLFKRVIPTGIKHGTVTILINEDAFEITTYRIDGKYSDGRRPDEIKFTPSIKEDLLRRDFTINSIAYNIEDSTILDINNGIEDLNKNIIKAIGIPSKRFNEDALRLVRACRFASQLNFSIEDATYKAMSKTLNKLPDVSKERISEELLKILSSNHPSIAFKHFYECGMLKILFPDIYKSTLKDKTAFNNALIDIDRINTKKQYIRYARLLSITDPNEFYINLKNMKLSNFFINHTIKLLNFINTDIKLIKTDYDIRKFISKIGKSNINDILTLWSGMKNIDSLVLSKLENSIQKEINLDRPFEIKDLKITGHDIMVEKNIKPGPEIKEILDKLLERTLKEPELNNKEQLLLQF